MDNVVSADRGAYLQATEFESDLMRLAFDFSTYPERPMPWTEVSAIFRGRKFVSYTPDEEKCRAFVRASKDAHRLESSLMVEPSDGTTDHPLVFRLKFYYKDERQPFFEWQMTFGDFGRLYQCGITGHGDLGRRAFGRPIRV